MKTLPWNVRMDEQHAKDAAALADPRPGDRWHEMYSFWLDVLDVSDRWVMFWVNGKPKPRIVSRERFRQYLSYGTIPGTWASICKRGDDPRNSANPDENGATQSREVGG